MKYSIQNEQEGATVAAEVVMLRAASNKAALIVEGTSDYKLFASYVLDAGCDIVIGWGKDNCIAAIEILNARPVLGVLALVGRDYDDFLDKVNDVPNVLTGDDHDIETTLIKSNSLEKLLRELGSEEKIKSQRENGIDLRNELVDAAHPLGVARLYSLINGLDLKFDGLKFRYLSKKLTFDLEELFKEVCNHSQKHNVSPDGYLAEIEKWGATAHDRWQMCCGHDLCHILGVALQSLWGSRNAGEVTQGEIESRLRMGFEADYLRSIGLYASMKKWEAENQPYCILRL